MKTIGNLMIIGLVISLIGILLKMVHVSGGGMIITMSLSSLSILAFIQLAISIGEMNNNKALKILTTSMSFTLAISFIAILFRYQFWPGWHQYFIVGTVLFILLSILYIIILYKKLISAEFKKMLLKNLLIPWAFIFIFGGLHYLLSSESFYDSFNSKSSKMTYHQFLDRNVEKPVIETNNSTNK